MLVVGGNSEVLRDPVSAFSRIMYPPLYDHCCALAALACGRFAPSASASFSMN